MMENAISSSSLYSPGSTLNYSQAAMMGLSGSHGGLQDPQQLSYTGHGGIPNIILTGEGYSGLEPGGMKSVLTDHPAREVTGEAGSPHPTASMVRAPPRL